VRDSSDGTQYTSLFASFSIRLKERSIRTKGSRLRKFMATEFPFKDGLIIDLVRIRTPNVESAGSRDIRFIMELMASCSVIMQYRLIPRYR
jgi:hypothetical protein